MTLKNLIYILPVILLFNCSSSDNDDLDPKEEEKEEEMVPIEKLTYNDNIKTIISNNCIECHGDPLQRGAPFPLLNFTQVKDKIDRIIFRVNNSSRPMPPSGPINATLRDNIQQWKDDGLLEN